MAEGGFDLSSARHPDLARDADARVYRAVRGGPRRLPDAQRPRDDRAGRRHRADAGTPPPQLRSAGMLLVKKPDGAPWFFVDQEARQRECAARPVRRSRTDRRGSGRHGVVRRGAVVREEQGRPPAPRARSGKPRPRCPGSRSAMASSNGSSRPRESAASSCGTGKTPSQVRPDKDQKDVSFLDGQGLLEI